MHKAQTIQKALRSSIGPVTLALKKLRQGDYECEASLERLSPNKVEEHLLRDPNSR